MDQALLNHPAIEIVPTASVRSDPRHPRRHSEKQVRECSGALRRFGQKVPILIDDKNQIVDDQAVFLEAAKVIGLEELTVLRTSFLNDTERRAYLLAHVRLRELGEWDEEILRGELEFLFEFEGGLEGTGFSTVDLDFSIPEQEPAEERVELPEPSARAITRLGDLWAIGPHRLLCGDAKDPASYDRLLEGQLASLVASDPPYGVRVQGHIGGKGATKYREFVEMSGRQTNAELTTFFRAFLRNCAANVVDGAFVYAFIDWRHAYELQDAARGVMTELTNVCVWTKPSPGLGSGYRSAHEFCLVFRSGRAKRTRDLGLTRRRTRSNHWQYPGANGFYKGRKRDLQDHPTVKNSAMIADILLDASLRGELVLDPFAGSATTLLAAHRTRRRGAAIELDPLYVDCGLRRLKDATGIEPVRHDGQTFAELSKLCEAADA